MQLLKEKLKKITQQKVWFIAVIVIAIACVGVGAYMVVRNNVRLQPADNGAATNPDNDTSLANTPAEQGKKSDTSKSKKQEDPKKKSTNSSKDKNAPSPSTSTGGSQATTNNSGSNGGSGTTPPVTTAWPNASNTGVPAGTTLTNYSGCVGDETNITTNNTTIDSKTINCHVVIRAANVRITKTKINGTVTLDTDAPGSSQWSLRLEDTEVNADQIENFSAVSYGHLTIIRSNIHGGQHNVQCVEDCEIRDSYLHTPYTYDIGGNPSHNNAFISNGGSDFQLVHNTLSCETPVSPGGGGCSGDLSLFGDFAPISDVTIDNNFFVASLGLSYCLYGGSQSSKTYGHQAHDIRVTNNVFQRGSNNKCGAYGTHTYYTFDNGGQVPSGNVWTNNKWEDGAVVNF